MEKLLRGRLANFAQEDRAEKKKKIVKKVQRDWKMRAISKFRKASKTYFWNSSSVLWRIILINENSCYFPKFDERKFLHTKGYIPLG